MKSAARRPSRMSQDSASPRSVGDDDDAGNAADSLTRRRDGSDFEDEPEDDLAARPGESDGTALSPIETRIIDFFVRLGTGLSFPKSIGEIFGLLYCSADPVPFEDVVVRLGISKGSASSGLKTLQKLKAVDTVYVARDRRTFYRAETSVRHLVSNLLDETVRPHLDLGLQQLREIREELESSPPDDGSTPAIRRQVLSHRLRSLEAWHVKARRLLPWAARLSSPKKR